MHSVLLPERLTRVRVLHLRHFVEKILPVSYTHLIGRHTERPAHQRLPLLRIVGFGMGARCCKIDGFLAQIFVQRGGLLFAALSRRCLLYTSRCV